MVVTAATLGTPMHTGMFYRVKRLRLFLFKVDDGILRNGDSSIFGKVQQAITIRETKTIKCNPFSLPRSSIS